MSLSWQKRKNGNPNDLSPFCNWELYKHNYKKIKKWSQNCDYHVFGNFCIWNKNGKHCFKGGFGNVNNIKESDKLNHYEKLQRWYKFNQIQKEFIKDFKEIHFWTQKNSFTSIPKPPITVFETAKNAQRKQRKVQENERMNKTTKEFSFFRDKIKKENIRTNSVWTETNSNIFNTRPISKSKRISLNITNNTYNQIMTNSKQIEANDWIYPEYEEKKYTKKEFFPKLARKYDFIPFNLTIKSLLKCKNPSTKWKIWNADKDMNASKIVTENDKKDNFHKNVFNNLYAIKTEQLFDPKKNVSLSQMRSTKSVILKIKRNQEWNRHEDGQ